MYFREQAATWDSERRILRAEKIAAKIREQIIRGACALEYGCGTGLVSFALGDYFQEIVLMDTEKEMVLRAKEKIAAAGVQHITAVQHDLVLAPYVGKQFDVIFSSMAMHHIWDLGLVVKRIYDMLRDGGVLCIIDLDTDDGAFHALEPGFQGHNGFAHSQMRKYFADVGLQEIQISTFLEDEKMIESRPLSYSLFCACGVKKEAND